MRNLTPVRVRNIRTGEKGYTILFPLSGLICVKYDMGSLIWEETKNICMI